MDVLLLTVALVAVYFLPAIFARLMHHPKTAAITVLNLLFGWTVLGWGIAMVWAFAGPEYPPKREYRR